MATVRPPPATAGHRRPPPATAGHRRPPPATAGHRRGQSAAGVGGVPGSAVPGGAAAVRLIGRMPGVGP
ncbi:hypothetical protein [Micromonospora sp. NPDC007230]|uniref:hypothetical protein n=1 Tax=Micromonospora sp. NPDC007230 TaxID=3364237 RepID=UPI0036BEE145